MADRRDRSSSTCDSVNRAGQGRGNGIRSSDGESGGEGAAAPAASRRHGGSPMRAWVRALGSSANCGSDTSLLAEKQHAISPAGCFEAVPPGAELDGSGKTDRSTLQVDWALRQLPGGRAASGASTAHHGGQCTSVLPSVLLQAHEVPIHNACFLAIHSCV